MSSEPEAQHFPENVKVDSSWISIEQFSFCAVEVVILTVNQGRGITISFRAGHLLRSCSKTSFSFFFLYNRLAFESFLLQGKTHFFFSSFNRNIKTSSIQRYSALLFFYPSASPLSKVHVTPAQVASGFGPCNQTALFYFPLLLRFILRK